jgi:hypothetical protein
MSKLVIQFRCLCFFVADEATGQMHVVAPATCGCENGGVEKHSAFLVFPKDGGKLNAAGNFKADGEPGKADYVPMEGWAMTLGNGTSTVFALPSSTIDLDTVVGKGVNPALVRGPRDKRITSRITLQGGQPTGTMTPGIWSFQGAEIPLARDVTWTIDGFPDGPLSVRRSRFAVGQQPNPAGDEEVVLLKPNKRNEFRLDFHHSREGDFGRPLVTLDPDSAAQHFAAYYTLYDNPPAVQPIPTFVTSPDVGVVGCLDGGGHTP